MRRLRIVVTSVLASSALSGCEGYGPADTPVRATTDVEDVTVCAVEPNQITDRCRAGEWIVLPPVKATFSAEALALCELDSPIFPAEKGIDSQAIVCRYRGVARKVWQTTPRDAEEVFLISPLQPETTKPR
jgi:hypothetical protein